jgi:hypothetical protein
VSKWVKATDRLRESDTAVLVFPGTHGVIEVAAWIETDQQWWGIARRQDLRSITHWMPPKAVPQYRAVWCHLGTE